MHYESMMIRWEHFLVNEWWLSSLESHCEMIRGNEGTLRNLGVEWKMVEVTLLM